MIYSRLLTTFLFICLTLLAESQVVSDSLYFKSTEEKELFNSTDGEGIFKLFGLISTSPDLNFDSEYEKFVSFVNELNQDYRGRKVGKRIDLIYDGIHESYFEKYDEDATFGDAFTVKEYNCVTATAMYAVAFEQLNIPYAIRLTPNHVYLVAYPEAERIILETTDPVYGSLEIDSKYISKVRRSLEKSKIISKAESVGYDESNIFEGFILTDSLIVLKDLVGVQYYNNAVSHFNEKNPKLAYLECDKADFLCEYQSIKDWKNILGLNLLDTRMDSLSAEEIYTLTKRTIIHRAEGGELLDYPKQVYLEIARKIIGAGQGLAKLEKLNAFFEKDKKEGLVAGELYDFGNIICAEAFMNALDYSKALHLLAKSYNEGETNYHIFIQDVLGKHMNEIKRPNFGLDTLEKYESIFPFVKESSKLQDFGTWYFSKLIYGHFDLNDENEGLRELERFKDRYPIGRRITYSDRYIGVLFGAASAYYVRQDDYTRAKTFLRKGLEYAPDSQELKRKLKLIVDEENK